MSKYFTKDFTTAFHKFLNTTMLVFSYTEAWDIQHVNMGASTAGGFLKRKHENKRGSK